MYDKESKEEIVSNSDTGAKHSTETNQSKLLPQQKEQQQLHEVLPKSGILFFEQQNLELAMCKPKIMPSNEMKMKIQGSPNGSSMTPYGFH